MKGAQMEIKDEALRSPIYSRCAKAACVLYLLKSSPNRRFKTPTDDQDEEKDLMKKEIEYLKMKLARERTKSKRIKLCSITEVILQFLVAFSFSTVVLMLVFGITFI